MMAPEPLKKTIEEILKGLRPSENNIQQKIWAGLAAQLSKREQKHASPAGLKGAILTLNVDSPAWGYSLNLKKQSILKALQASVGQDKIKDIRLKIGKVR